MNLEQLATEAHNRASAAIDGLSPLEIARLMNYEDGQVAAAVGRVVPAIAEAIELVAGGLRAGG